MRSIRRSLSLAAVLMLVPAALVLSQPAPPRITGFRADAARAELDREAAVAAAVRPDSLRRHLRILTAEPHVAGTPADKATAEYVRQRMAAYGWDARIEAFPVYLNYPAEVRVDMVEPARETLAVRERGVPWDKDAYGGGAFDAFHGYGASGEVTAPVVYANYGDVDDLKKLALASEKVTEMLNGKQVRKVIVVPKKLVNVVIS